MLLNFYWAALIPTTKDTGSVFSLPLKVDKLICFATPGLVWSIAFYYLHLSLLTDLQYCYSMYKVDSTQTQLTFGARWAASTNKMIIHGVTVENGVNMLCWISRVWLEIFLQLHCCYFFIRLVNDHVLERVGVISASENKIQECMKRHVLKWSASL